MKKYVRLLIASVVLSILCGCTADFRSDSFTTAIIADPQDIEETSLYFGLTWNLGK